MTFDPINQTLGGANPIPVAVGRDMRHVTPVAGGYLGLPTDFHAMAVKVSVAATSPPNAVIEP